MKRPLFIVAVVLVLGIFMMNQQAGLRDVLLFDRPAFAARVSYAKSGFYAGELKGTVEWIRKKNGKQILAVDGGKTYGKVYCYLDREELLPPEYIGCEIRLEGSFFLFRESENPGEFDSRSYYENLGIYLGFTVSDMAVLKQAEFAPKRPFYAIYRKAEYLLSSFAEEADLAFFERLLTTVTGASDETFDDLDCSYLSQLLSVSGLLVSTFGMLIYGLMKRLTKSNLIRASVPVILMVCYGWIIGSPFSYVRALLIFSVRIFAPVFRRSFDFLSAAALSFLLLIAARPTYVLLPGVYCYFAVLLAVGIAYPSVKRLLRIRSGLYLYAVMLLMLQCAFLPVSLSTSFGINLWQPLLSAILLPLKTLAMTAMLCGFIIGFLSDSSRILPFFFGFAHYLRIFTEQITEGVNAMPLSSICTGKPALWRCIVYEALYGVIFAVTRVFLMIRKYKPESREVLIRTKHKAVILGFLVLCYLFGILFLQYDRPKGEEVIYVQLSCGQGDSAILMSEDFTMVADNGSSSLDNPGEILSNALRYYGVQTVDVMILSHADADHTNGVRELLQDGRISVSEIWISGAKNETESYYESLSTVSSRTVIRQMTYGTLYEKSGAALKVLHPKSTEERFGNDVSLVVSFEKGRFSALLAGDISADAEKDLPLLRTAFTVLKVAHHGSKYSSSEEFLRKIDAKYAFISAGKNNSYGHPHRDAVERLRNDGAELYCTADCGAIELRYEGKGPLIRTFLSND